MGEASLIFVETGIHLILLSPLPTTQPILPLDILHIGFKLMLLPLNLPPALIIPHIALPIIHQHRLHHRRTPLLLIYRGIVLRTVVSVGLSGDYGLVLTHDLFGVGVDLAVDDDGRGEVADAIGGGGSGGVLEVPGVLELGLLDVLEVGFLGGAGLLTVDYAQAGLDDAAFFIGAAHEGGLGLGVLCTRLFLPVGVVLLRLIVIDPVGVLQFPLIGRNPGRVLVPLLLATLPPLKVLLLTLNHLFLESLTFPLLNHRNLLVRVIRLCSASGLDLDFEVVVVLLMVFFVVVLFIVLLVLLVLVVLLMVLFVMLLFVVLLIVVVLVM